MTRAQSNASQFPFVDKCGHCGDQNKAYRCHHCNELIFLTEDEDKTNYAHGLNAPTETTPAQEHTEKVKKLRASKELKEAKLSSAQVDAELLALRNRIKLQNPKKKSETQILEEVVVGEVKWDIAKHKLENLIEKEYASKPKLQTRMRKALKEKILDGLPDR